MKKLKNNELLWESFDLDGTLVDTKYPNYKLEEATVIEENCAIVRKLHKNGWKIIIFTARPSSEYIGIEEWLNKHKIPFKAIITGKPLCHRYWDDRAINPFCKECIKKWNESDSVNR